MSKGAYLGFGLLGQLVNTVDKLGNPKRWVWTDKGAEVMRQLPGRFVWDHYKDCIPPAWVADGWVREATPEDGEPGQMDLLDFV
ncbi:hypothetical protein BVG16_13440 [Paenibacillus selenitireducens]|uniref:Uncharacterized protein n=1 Tax=Paenibacillus selenitireducens TaxID=1324314 RepID=A0A1T2XCA4_9BACL|nr:hypothetical protein [Paenibacillus selenitireducens]OPA77455.1 hypothetical protein BVG16_13440 [Paenibacillus selenitireducens]